VDPGAEREGGGGELRLEPVHVHEPVAERTARHWSSWVKLTCGNWRISSSAFVPSTSVRSCRDSGRTALRHGTVGIRPAGLGKASI
jgi:hypothetical protein